jgi:hypothetical protein
LMKKKRKYISSIFWPLNRHIRNMEEYKLL